MHLFICLTARDDDPLIDSKLLSLWTLKSCCLMPLSWRKKINLDDVDVVSNSSVTLKVMIMY